MIVRCHVHAHNIIIAYYETMPIHIMTLSILHVMNSTTVISILLDRKNPSLKKERERESKEIPLTERERERERKKRNRYVHTRYIIQHPIHPLQ